MAKFARHSSTTLSCVLNRRIPTASFIGILLVVVGLISESVPGEYGTLCLCASEIGHISERNLEVELVSIAVDTYPDGRPQGVSCRLQFRRDGTSLGLLEASAHRPVEFEGLTFVLRDIGWSGVLKLTDASGAVLQTETLKTGDCVYYEPKQLFIALYDFFPELSLESDGRISSESVRTWNPYFAVALKEKDTTARIELVEPGATIVCGGVGISFGSYAVLGEIAYGKRTASLLLPFGFIIVPLGLALYRYRKTDTITRIS